MKFIIFHGSLSKKNDNWFKDLKTKLECMGQTVYAPQFPIDDIKALKNKIPKKTKQNLKDWLDLFEKKVLPKIKTGEKLFFIGHSLGNIFILHAVEKFNLKLDGAIFVSPFLDRLNDIPAYYNKVNSTFYKTDFDFDNLRKQIPVSYVLYSDTDPYVEPHRAKHFAAVLQSSTIMVKKADHFSSSVNMSEFPLVFDLCVSRLNLGLYQKYIYKHEHETSILNLINAKNKILKLTPEQLKEEGKFHSLNLLKNGFATFMTTIKNFDPNNQYFAGTRIQSQNGLDITRVFIVKDKKDLKRKLIQKQIKLDFKAKIKVYLIRYTDMQQIGCAEDFGIWDNEYVCIQNINNQGKLTGGIIDSKVKSLLTAQNWKDRIIRKAKKLNSLSELQHLLQ